MRLAKAMTGVAMGLVLAALSGSAVAQTLGEVIPLYKGAVPGVMEGTNKESQFDLKDSRFTPPNPDTLVVDVKVPTLTVVRPAAGTANGAAIVIAPGGGFRVLSYKNEGIGIANYLAARGVTCFILKYRLHDMPSDPKAIEQGLQMMMKAAASRPPAGAAAGPPNIPMGPIEMGAISDGEAAIKLVRSRAREFGIDPTKIGIIGFSAGGVVSGGASIGLDPADRPAFTGVIYSSTPGTIPQNSPPAFLAAAADDPLSAGMPDLFSRWRASGSSAELHIFAKGQHGFGSSKQNLPVDHWLDMFYAWLGQQGIVPTTH